MPKEGGIMGRPATVKDLRKAYEKAVREGKDTFSIDGYDFVTGYAKYLLEYLKMRGIPDDKVLKTFITQDRNGEGGIAI
jgi:hypothetical protein